MGVLLFYIIALLPVAVGGALWVFRREVVWQEWLAGSVAAFLFAGIAHAMALYGMTTDTETWSGQVVQSREFSAWLEYYEYAVYRTEYSTDSKGHTTSHQVFDHWEPSTEYHSIHWRCWSNIDTDYNITQARHHHLEQVFHDRHPEPGDRTTFKHSSRMISGDPYDYVADAHTSWVEPVTKAVRFENRVKAAPSVFSYVQPPPKTVYDYPENSDPFSSDRLLGSAAIVGTFAWDQLNARLGPSKKVNVIMVGFKDQDDSYGHMQEARWIGGKKNDLVITFGGNPKHPTWARVFGWTEHDLVKRNLESIILEHGALTETIPLIEKEIRANYALKDWSKFDYISVEPPAWSYWVYALVLVLGQAGFWWWAINNDYSKDAFDRMRNVYRRCR